MGALPQRGIQMQVQETVPHFHELGLKGLLDQCKAELGNGPCWLVFEGDWGGQIFLTVPWNLVGPKSRIYDLLVRLDKLAWSSNKGGGRLVYLVTGNEENVVTGGMGGGKLEEGLWLHEMFHGARCSDQQYLQDMLDGIRGATCDEVRDMNWTKIASDMLDLSQLPS